MRNPRTIVTGTESSCSVCKTHCSRRWARSRHQPPLPSTAEHHQLVPQEHLTSTRANSLGRDVAGRRRRPRALGDVRRSCVQFAPAARDDDRRAHVPWVGTRRTICERDRFHRPLVRLGTRCARHHNPLPLLALRRHATACWATETSTTHSPSFASQASALSSARRNAHG